MNRNIYVMVSTRLTQYYEYICLDTIYFKYSSDQRYILDVLFIIRNSNNASFIAFDSLVSGAKNAFIL